MSGLKEKDKLTERAAGSSGIEEKEGRGEAAIYASQKSPTKRGLSPRRRTAEKRGWRKDDELKGGKIELIVYHAARAKSIGGKLSCSSEYDIK